MVFPHTDAVPFQTPDGFSHSPCRTQTHADQERIPVSRGIGYSDGFTGIYFAVVECDWAGCGAAESAVGHVKADEFFGCSGHEMLIGAEVGL